MNAEHDLTNTEHDLMDVEHDLINVEHDLMDAEHRDIAKPSTDMDKKPAYNAGAIDGEKKKRLVHFFLYNSCKNICAVHFFFVILHVN